MRLWTLHPKYLDPQGLVALWREALLARAVLRGETRGYTRHPQLERFQLHEKTLFAIDAYLAVVFEESVSRGYSFNRSKIGHFDVVDEIEATSGQIEFEWRHLLRKLSARSPLIYEKLHNISDPECHPLFRIVSGQIEQWERGQNSG
jgi:Pyrimidine dimer DNA glycosylase